MKAVLIHLLESILYPSSTPGIPSHVLLLRNYSANIWRQQSAVVKDTYSGQRWPGCRTWVCCHCKSPSSTSPLVLSFPIWARLAWKLNLKHFSNIFILLKHKVFEGDSSFALWIDNILKYKNVLKIILFYKCRTYEEKESKLGQMRTLIINKNDKYHYVLLHLKIILLPHEWNF